MATITTDEIASVSLKDADRDPDAFARKLGRSFEEYGFAIIAGHGIPDALIRQAEDKAKALFALPEEVKRNYHIAGRRRRARLHAVRDRDRQGRQGTRPQGILARRPRPAAGPPVPRSHARQRLAGRGAGLQGHVPELYRRVRQRGPKHSRGDRPLSSRSTPDYFVDTVRDGNSVLRLLHYPPIAGDPAATSAPARTRTSTRSPCCSAPRKAGCELLDRDGHWLPVTPKPGELVVNIGDMLQRLTNKCCARPRTEWSTRRPSAAAIRATRCPSSSTSARIS